MHKERRSTVSASKMVANSERAYISAGSRGHQKYSYILLIAMNSIQQCVCANPTGYVFFLDLANVRGVTVSAAQCTEL